jgi:hypothetical protein
MIEMLNKIVGNPIGLSIITGIITFIITWPINNWLTKKTSKKEYFDRVGKTNSLIIETCTDYVIMEKTVKDKIFASIIKGACIQNKINEDDAYTVQSVKAILVKDFVNMRLIADDVKKEIINELCERSQLEEKEKIIIERIVHHEASSKKIEMFTSLITIIVTMFTVTLTLLVALDNPKSITNFTMSDFPNPLDWIVFLTLIILCIELLIFFLMKIKRKKREQRNLDTFTRSKNEEASSEEPSKQAFQIMKDCIDIRANSEK